jgi:ATP-binding cassette, subfamily B (MDR/TAP), member 1
LHANSHVDFGSVIIVGTIGAVLAGFTFPAWGKSLVISRTFFVLVSMFVLTATPTSTGVIFAYMVELFFNPVACPPLQDGFDSCQAYFDSEANSMKDLSFYLFYGYIGLCVTAVVGNMTLFYGFSSASEKMNKKVSCRWLLIVLATSHASNDFVQIRDSAFTSLIRQEVSYFDMRAAGTITSQLADDAAMLHAFVGEPIRTITVSVASVVVGLVVSFVFMWYAWEDFGFLHPFLSSST